MSKQKKSQHVVKYDGGWAVKKGGSSRVSKHFATKKEAIDWGRKVAKNQKAEFYIHGRDGKIIDGKYRKIIQKDSYGNDPNPPKDKN